MFQHAVDIPATVLPSWRRARTTLSNAEKATLRANHFALLRNQGLPTLWSVGAGRMPNFLPLDDTSKRDLAQSKRDHGLRCLEIMESSLRRKAEMDRNLGSTFQIAIGNMFPSPTQAVPALTLLTTLVAKDKASTNTILNNRYASLSAHPVTDDQVLATMVIVTPPPTPTPATATPPTVLGATNQNYRGRGAFNVNQRPQQRPRSQSPRRPARGRGQNRGRGQTRGSTRGGSRGGRGRGQDSSRSRSPANRLVSLANDVQAFTAEEILVINTLRQSRNQPLL